MSIPSSDNSPAKASLPTTGPPDRRTWLWAAARFCALAALADERTARRALKVLAEDATRAAREGTA